MISYITFFVKTATKKRKQKTLLPLIFIFAAYTTWSISVFSSVIRRFSCTRRDVRENARFSF